MALEIETYLPTANDSLIEPWMKRMHELGMQCELHPEFSFETQTAFLPIKLRLLRPTRDEFRDKEFLTGFEFYLSAFDISAIPFAESAPTGLARLFRKNKQPLSYRIAPDIDEKLEKCKHQLTFRFGAGDVFELRMADMSSLVLMELTGGIRYLPIDGVWNETNNFSEANLESIEEFERSLEKGSYNVHPFEGWLE